MGVLLGGLIGTILLIAIPRMVGGGEAQTEAPAASAPAESTATEGTASAGAGASGEQAPGATSNATEASTAAEGAEAVQTEASGSAGTPTADAEGDAEAGKAVYASQGCAGCHGANGEGGVGPALANAKTWSLGQFATALREGKTPEKELQALMPRFGTDKISDADMANLHAYVQSLP